MLQWSTSVKQWRSPGHYQSKKGFSNIYIFWRTKSQPKKVLNVMPSISRITKKQGWQYILGIQQAGPPWTGIIMFLKRLSKCPHMMRIMFGLWKTISLQFILWNITWLFWQVPGLQKHHNWGLSLPLRLGKGAWDELVHFSRGIKTKQYSITSADCHHQVNDNNRGIESPDLEKVDDRCPEKVTHSPHPHPHTHPSIHPSNYENTITGFYILKT